MRGQIFRTFLEKPIYAALFKTLLKGSLKSGDSILLTSDFLLQFED